MRLIEVLSTRKSGPVPVWLMRQAGRYLPEYRALRAQAGSFLDLCYTPPLACAATLQPVRRFGFDAAILFSDILVVPDALGQKLDFVEGEGPRLEPVADGKALARLAPDGAGRELAPVIETVARVREALEPERALIGFCGAPWTVATYMVAGQGTPDQAPARLWAYRDPEGFSALIDMLVAASVDYLDAQITAGADAVQIFDTWAGALPAGEFERWCVAPVKRLVGELRTRHPATPVIAFPRGAGSGYERLVAEIVPEGIAIDTSYRVGEARERLQGRAAVQGNLDPVVLLAGGAALDRAVDDILNALAGGPFIFNLGHGILPETPPEHVGRLVERVRGWRG